MFNNDTAAELQGWTSSPNIRGTLDILWDCLATIFLSTWSAICLNVAKPQDTQWTIFKRKTWITFISIMGPEYLLGFALGEWRSARASVAHLRQLRGDDKWSLKHAFFADMGGFMLRTSDGVKFFLDTRHIHWMLEHKVFSMEEFERSFMIDGKAIDDRNKSDIFVRVLAVGQALWFCVDIIARGLQGLAVTTLEVTTIGIIVDSILVYYFWKDKPADVEYSEIVDIGMTLDEMISLEQDGRARSQPWFRTPLDFTSREIWSFNLIYHYLMNILKRRNKTSWREKQKNSLGRRDENDVLPLNGISMAIALLSTIAFMGTNFIAWDFHFPTVIEKRLWQTVSCGLIAITIIGMPIVHLKYDSRGIERMQEKVRKRRKALEDACVPTKEASWRDRLVYHLKVRAMKMRNNSVDDDPNLDMSLFMAFGSAFVFALYTAGRVYILVEDFIAFRALPVGAYKTVQWMAFLPHVG